MKTECEAFDKFLIFKTFVERQTNQNIKILRFNQGGEYKSKEFFEYCQKEGIKEFIITYTFQ
jgi:hypothetical protein